MVIVICHRDHRCVRKSPAKAPGTDLPVEPREGLTTHALLCEDVWIFFQDFADGVVLSVQLFLVLDGCEDESIVLNCEDVVLRPIAEELDVRHQIEVRRPERIFSLLIFINDEDEKNELLPILALVLVEQVRIFFNHFAEFGMFLGLVYRHDAFEGHLQERLPVLDRSLSPDTNKPTLEVGWILLVGIDNSVLGAPIIEDFALS